MPNTVYNQQVIFYSLVLGQQSLIALQINIFIKVSQCILKSLETFLIQMFFYGNVKKAQIRKKKKKKKGGGGGQILIWLQIP